MRNWPLPWFWTESSLSLWMTSIFGRPRSLGASPLRPFLLTELTRSSVGGSASVSSTGPSGTSSVGVDCWTRLGRVICRGHCFHQRIDERKQQLVLFGQTVRDFVDSQKLTVTAAIPVTRELAGRSTLTAQTRSRNQAVRSNDELNMKIYYNPNYPN